VIQESARTTVSQKNTAARLTGYSTYMLIDFHSLTPEPSAEESEAFGHSIRNCPVFADSAGALQYLKQHYKFVILSNVDRESFETSNERLQIEFDYVHTRAHRMTKQRFVTDAPVKVQNCFGLGAFEPATLQVAQNP